MEFSENIEFFNKPIIKEKNYIIANHKIFLKYSSSPYQKYSFELIQTLCKKSNFENKPKILHKSIYFLLKFLYKTRNNILISNYDIIILISFYLGIKTVENQKKIPNITKLKNIYKEKFGEYKNNEIQNAEIIFLKILEYKINFMTSYDYLCYLFQNKKEFMEFPKNNLEFIIKEKTREFCTNNPITIIHECVKQIEKNNLLRCPIVIKKKIVQQKNIFFKDLTKNIDESLSTSISSGYYNNNHNNDIKTIYHKHKEIERNSPLDKIISKYINISLEKSCVEKNVKNNYKYCFSNEKYCNNITINNTNYDYDEICDTKTYNKTNIKNLKNLKKLTKKKDNKNEKKQIIYRTNIKEKIFQRNIIPLSKLKLNFTNNNMNDNSQNKVYTKPYFKRDEYKGYFTSNKKKDNELRYNYFRIFNKNNNNGEALRCSLKKKLFVDEDEDY